MQYSKSAYGAIPARLKGVNRNADNGWGGYEWTEDGSRRVPERLIGVAQYQNTLGHPLRIRIRRELVPLTVLMWKIAEAVGYCIHTTNPNGNGENWGPWGGEDRPMGGTKVASNHSRFRAEDDNAPYNPMVSAFITDMDPRYVAAREECGFYWGGRYNGKTDTMHFEYVGTPADVAADERRARQILEALTAPRPIPSTPAPSTPATPVPPAAPTPAPTPKDWFDMATIEDLRKVVREELAYLINEDETEPGSLKAAVLAMANKSAGQLGYAYATVAANTTSAEEFAELVRANAETNRSDGLVGAGDLGRWIDGVTPAVADRVAERLAGGQ